MNSSQTKTYGRVAITGLHSVVFGYPALVSSISLGVTVTIRETTQPKNHYYVESILEFLSEKLVVNCNNLELNINSELPVGSGLSSSTAVAGAVIKATFSHLSKDLDNETLFNLLVEFESRFYSVSGMDQAAIAFGGLIQFQRVKDTLNKVFISKKNSLSGQKILLIDSGGSQESTQELVNSVKAKKEKEPEKYNRLLKQMGANSQLMIESLDKENFRFDVWQESHRHFIKLELVGSKACEIVEKVESIGGNCKQSGAGGFETGSGILLAQHEDVEKLITLSNKKGWKYWEVTLCE